MYVRYIWQGNYHIYGHVRMTHSRDETCQTCLVQARKTHTLFILKSCTHATASPHPILTHSRIKPPFPIQYILAFEAYQTGRSSLLSLPKRKKQKEATVVEIILIVSFQNRVANIMAFQRYKPQNTAPAL